MTQMHQNILHKMGDKAGILVSDKFKVNPGWVKIFEHFALSSWTSWTELDWNASTFIICHWRYTEEISYNKLKGEVLP